MRLCESILGAEGGPEHEGDHEGDQGVPSKMVILLGSLFFENTPKMTKKHEDAHRFWGRRVISLGRGGGTRGAHCGLKAVHDRDGGKRKRWRVHGKNPPVRRYRTLYKPNFEESNGFQILEQGWMNGVGDARKQ